MGDFNEELVKAGVMESGDGLKPSRDGYRVRFSGSERTVTKGPFIETNELLAGYWIWNVNSMEEAIAWVKKCPNPMPMEETCEIEIRTFYNIDDFADADPDGKGKQKEEALRTAIAMQKSSINNYLSFSGRCEEALNYYQQNLGAKINFMMRFDQSPDPVPEGMLQPGFENKIMHADFSLGDQKIFASDGCDDKSPFSGFRLSVRVQNEEEAHRIFDVLTKGGNVDMPLGKTFFSPLYGMVTDQFGVGWMVMIPGEQPM
jgi:uncharacterized glyoxalase superfamily protein PhnB